MSATRKITDVFNYFLTRLKSRRRYKINRNFSDVKLNLGCGLAVHHGWINIDGSLNAFFGNLPSFFQRFIYKSTGASQYYTNDEYNKILKNNIFIHHDLSFGIPYSDATVDYIFSSHFLEHLFEKDAMNLLKECYRVLKPGGLIRISVPDLEYAVTLYNQNQKDQTLRDYFFNDDRENYFSRHKYMYDYEMMFVRLKRLGFQKINRCTYRSGSLPDCEFLDNRPRDSLFIEAKK